MKYFNKKLFSTFIVKHSFENIRGGKWTFTLNLLTMQQNAPVLKLFSKIPLFLKLNFNKIELGVKLDILKIELYVYF